MINDAQLMTMTLLPKTTTTVFVSANALTNDFIDVPNDGIILTTQQLNTKTQHVSVLGNVKLISNFRKNILFKESALSQIS